jgi:hypothetical protein
MGQDELKELLTYYPETGQFYWNTGGKGRRLDRRAGSFHKASGYIHIGICGKKYRAHRLAWLYTYGFLPENLLDHINRDRADNRIDNLRAVDMVENTKNNSVRVDNTSGVTGVCWAKREGKWLVRISSKFIGYTDSLGEAIKLRLKAAKDNGYTGEAYDARIHSRG